MDKYVIPDELVDRLDKGSTIPRSAIEPLLPTFDDEDSYRIHLMCWVAQLGSAMAKAGKPVTIRTRGYGQTVVILTDSEASTHNARFFGKYLRRARRRHDHLMDVDASRLGLDEQKTHERNVCVQAAILSGIAATRREFSPVAHRRVTPTLQDKE
jgi:hypothetical protein